MEDITLTEEQIKELAQLFEGHEELFRACSKMNLEMLRNMLEAKEECEKQKKWNKIQAIAYGSSVGIILVSVWNLLRRTKFYKF